MEPERDLRYVGFQGKETRRVSPRSITLRPSLALPASSVQESNPGPGESFVRWLLTEAGLHADIYRPASLERRTAACLRAMGVASTVAARDLIRTHPDRLPVAVTTLLIGVTDFFRDPNVFDGLRLTVLPELSNRPGPLRIWSAACSSGPELYSLAILLAEAGLIDRSFLLGTDCRSDAIDVARRGAYTEAQVRSLPARIRTDYFESDKEGWRVAGELRDRVHWDVWDLWNGTQAGPWDIIVWRNAAIYLKPAPVARTISALVASLRVGGFLVLGKAERPPDGAGVVPVSACTYRRIRE
jgi:chemotaxis methyl-accepting protein methylase